LVQIGYFDHDALSAILFLPIILGIRFTMTAIGNAANNVLSAMVDGLNLR
jgi:hypothetical protein